VRRGFKTGAPRGRRLQRRIEELEGDIEAVEAQLAELLDAAGKAGEAGDLDEVRRLGEAHRSANTRRHELWDEYERLHAELDALA